MSLLLCICGLLIRSQAASPQTEVTLKFQPLVGKTYKYRSSMEMTMDSGGVMPANSMKTGMDIDLKILAQKDDVFSIESKTSNASVEAPEGALISSMKDQMVEKMNGKVVKADIDSSFKPRGSSSTGLDSIFSSMQGLNFPTHSVKIGESWKSTLDFNKMLGAMFGNSGLDFKVTGDLPIVNKLESIDQVNGATVANIRMTMNGDLQVSVSGQEMKMHIASDGNFKIDVLTGTTFSTKMTSDNRIEAASITMNQHMIQSMTLR